MAQKRPQNLTDAHFDAMQTAWRQQDGRVASDEVEHAASAQNLQVHKSKVASRASSVPGQPEDQPPRDGSAPVGAMAEADDGRADVHRPYQDADQMFRASMSVADVQPLRPDVERHPTRMRAPAPRSATVDEVDVPPTANELREPTLTRAQRTLAKSLRSRTDIPELSLRLMTQREAMKELVAFIREQRAYDERFVRIITGKGKRSASGPVIKPAVVQWCRSQVRAGRIAAFSPLPDRSGDYGVIVVELAFDDRTDAR